MIMLQNNFFYISKGKNDNSYLVHYALRKKKNKIILFHSISYSLKTPIFEQSFSSYFYFSIQNRELVSIFQIPAEKLVSLLLTLEDHYLKVQFNIWSCN